MLNLIHFNFILGTPRTVGLFPGELFNGYVWKEMLELYVPYLSEFEFHMSIMKRIFKARFRQDC